MTVVQGLIQGFIILAQILSKLPNCSKRDFLAKLTVIIVYLLYFLMLHYLKKVLKMQIIRQKTA